MKQPVTICWFRRDLRLDDNTALCQALKSGFPVLPLFIFDKNILNKLSNKKDKRVAFLHNTILALQDELKKYGSTFHVVYDTPEQAFQNIIRDFDVKAVYTNEDYESYAINRDNQIATLLAGSKIPFHLYKDHVLFAKNEVTKDDGLPYTVFTPYSKKWKIRWNQNPPLVSTGFDLDSHLLKTGNSPIPTLQSMGFEADSNNFPSATPNEEIIRLYAERRDIPGILGTSRLGIHLRFGTISIRKLAKLAAQHSEIFLNELIWRDFYQMILWNFPHINNYQSFKTAYDKIEWRNNETEFEKWCEGNTGYPIVDAGMRELNTTGFMHNRVRMITASFLCKHLLIDWRWGEAYFAEKLLDFDFASNNGGWQWAAGSGCDAAPYFRIFNPYLQTKKFDPDFKYIRKWVPEFESFDYPKPIVVHEEARKKCLEVYSKALK
jgi:deoxyribodipyrimidine photo-lyase